MKRKPSIDKTCGTIIRKQERTCPKGHIWILEDHFNKLKNSDYLSITTMGGVVCPECGLPAKSHKPLDPMTGRVYPPTGG